MKINKDMELLSAFNMIGLLYLQRPTIWTQTIFEVGVWFPCCSVRQTMSAGDLPNMSAESLTWWTKGTVL